MCRDVNADTSLVGELEPLKPLANLLRGGADGGGDDAVRSNLRAFRTDIHA